MYYKWLTIEGLSYYQRWTWPLPTQNKDGTWTPGEWTPYVEELIECQSGYHACYDEIASLLQYSNDALYELEYKGDRKKGNDKAYGHKARLLRKVGEMGPRKWRLFSCDCAERVLHIYEAVYSDDDRLRRAIEVARRYANRKASDAELASAIHNAYAALVAAHDVAQAPDGAVVGGTRAAAVYAASRSAARAVCYAAQDGRNVALNTARDARDAGGTEGEWQRSRLFDYLEGRAG